MSEAPMDWASRPGAAQRPSGRRQVREEVHHLFVYPVALGGGRPFFADDTRVDLEFLETRTFGNRVVYLRYRRT